MKWALVREQLRSQRAYVIWSTLLILAATALTTFTWVAQATAAAQDSFATRGTGLDRGHFAQAALLPTTGERPADIADYGTPIAPDELVSLIDSANAQGADVIAAIPGTYVELGSDAHPGVGSEVTLTLGEVAWNEVLSDGAPPGSGGVVLSGGTADWLGVGIGDEVEVTVLTSAISDDPAPALRAPLGTRTVTGISYDRAAWPEEPWTGGTILGTDDYPELYESIEASQRTESGQWWAPVIALVSWETMTPDLAAAFPNADTDGAAAWTDVDNWLAKMFATVLALGIVVMSFAVGRAQAQERARWTATARALGATRGRVAVATLVEGLVIGLVGGAVGVATGAAVAWAQYRAYLNDLAAPPPVALVVPGAHVWPTLLGAVVLGLVIAGVPAFLATRVSPASALKDAAAVDEATISRRVPLWPVAVLFVASYVSTLAAMTSLSTPGFLWMLLSVPATVVTFIALTVSLSRRGARLLGAALSRSRRPAFVHAGLALLAHPRQAAGLMIIQALAMLGVTTTAIGSALTSGPRWLAWSPDPSPLERLAGTVVLGYPWTVVLGVLTIAQLLCLAIFASTRRLTAAEDRTSAALGLDTGGQRAADVARFALAQFTGAVAGTVAAAVLVAPMLIFISRWYSTGDASAGVVAVFQTGLGVVVDAVVIAVASAAVAVTRRTARRAPQTVGALP